MAGGVLGGKREQDSARAGLQAALLICRPQGARRADTFINARAREGFQPRVPRPGAPCRSPAEALPGLASTARSDGTRPNVGRAPAPAWPLARAEQRRPARRPGGQAARRGEEPFRGASRTGRRGPLSRHMMRDEQTRVRDGAMSAPRGRPGPARAVAQAGAARRPAPGIGPRLLRRCGPGIGGTGRPDQHLGQWRPPRPQTGGAGIAVSLHPCPGTAARPPFPTGRVSQADRIPGRSHPRARITRSARARRSAARLCWPSARVADAPAGCAPCWPAGAVRRRQRRPAAQPSRPAGAGMRGRIDRHGEMLDAVRTRTAAWPISVRRGTVPVTAPPREWDLHAAAAPERTCTRTAPAPPLMQLLRQRASGGPVPWRAQSCPGTRGRPAARMRGEWRGTTAPWRCGGGCRGGWTGLAWARALRNPAGRAHTLSRSRSSLGAAGAASAEPGGTPACALGRPQAHARGSREAEAEKPQGPEAERPRAGTRRGDAEKERSEARQDPKRAAQGIRRRHAGFCGFPPTGAPRPSPPRSSAQMQKCTS